MHINAKFGFKIYWTELKKLLKHIKEKKTFFVKLFHIIKFTIISPYLLIKFLFRRIGSFIWSIICGYGEKPWRTIFSALLIIAAYGLFYWYGNVLEPSQDFLGSMYFSIVTFTTLGYGDIKPLEFNNLFRFICSSEAFIGAFMIALFVWTLARRGAAR